LARRLVERDTRVVHILHRGCGQHGNVPKDLAARCLDTDQATAVLIQDLHDRGRLHKGGISYGETDDFSYNVVENPVHVNDFNATILHLMEIDHERFTFKF
jgi:hypothetical protein